MEIFSEDVYQSLLNRYQGLDQHVMSEIINKITFVQTKFFLRRIHECRKNIAFLVTEKVVYRYTGVITDSYGYKRVCYYSLKQHVEPLLATFILNDGSPLLEKVNRIVRGIIEAGIKTWWEEIEHPHYKLGQDKSPKKIHYKNLVFLFQLWEIGMGISFVVFLFEIFKSKKWICKKNIFQRQRIEFTN